MFLERLSDEEIAKIAKEYFDECRSDSHNDDGSFIMAGSVERMDELVSITAPYMTKHIVTAEDKARIKEMRSNSTLCGGKNIGKPYNSRHFVYMTDFSIESNATNPDESEFYARKMYGIFGDEWLEAYRKYTEREIEIMREIRISENRLGSSGVDEINERFDKQKEDFGAYFEGLTKLLKSNQEERE